MKIITDFIKLLLAQRTEAQSSILVPELINIPITIIKPESSQGGHPKRGPATNK